MIIIIVLGLFSTISGYETAKITLKRHIEIYRPNSFDHTVGTFVSPQSTIQILAPKMFCLFNKIDIFENKLQNYRF